MLDLGRSRAEPVRNSRFASRSAEVTFVSEDNVRFKIHSTNLAICSKGFVLPSNSTFDEDIHLTEDWVTLELLFQFIYPNPHPYTDDLEFAQLLGLAEAAEKYQVYPALRVCYLSMCKSALKYPVLVFEYASKHDHRALLSLVVPKVLDEPPSKMARQLRPELLCSWVEYQSWWQSVQKNALTSDVPEALYSKKEGLKTMQSISARLATGFHALQNLDEVFPSGAQGPIALWRENIERAVERIPSFLSLIGPKRVIPIPQEIDSGPKVQFKSSDGVIFLVSLLHLGVLTGNLEQLSHPLEVVSLPERAEILRLLFPFVTSPGRAKLALMDIDCELLMEVAYVAEKYKIFEAMNICRLRSMVYVQDHPFPIFQYGCAHRYPEIFNAAAPLVVSLPLDTVIERLPADFVLPYVRYYECWRNVIAKGLRFNESNIRQKTYNLRTVTINTTECTGSGCRTNIDPGTIDILKALGKGVSAFQQLDTIFAPSKACCETRQADLSAWKKSILADMNKIANFSNFLNL